MKKILSAFFVFILTAALFYSNAEASQNLSYNYFFDECKVEDNVCSVKGWYGARIPTVSMGYRIDGGEVVMEHVKVIPCDPAVHEDEAVLADAHAGKYGVRFKARIPLSGLSAGEHKIMLVAQLSNGHVVDALADQTGKLSYITADASGSEYVPADIDNFDDPPVITNSLIDTNGNRFTDNAQTDWYIQGWYGCNLETAELGYGIDNGKPVFDGSITIRKDAGLNSASYGRHSYRFYAHIDASELDAGAHSVKIYARLNDYNRSVIPVLVDARGAYSVNITKTAAAAVLKGDINGDKAVNNKDLIALFRYVSGIGISVNSRALDVNGDKSVNKNDVLYLFKLL